MNLQAADFMVAIITPFDENNQINYPALDRLTDHLLEKGANGFVIGGTTGETPTLSHDEKLALYKHFGAYVDGRVPVIAGTGSNNTAETIAFTNEVAEIDGIDVALVVVPPYNKPNQRGMIAHFTKVADEVNIPVMIYNIPGRTGVKMEVSTLVELSHHENIVVVKQCASLTEMQAFIDQTPDDFAVFSGEDAQALFTKVIGGAGVISVAGHVYPAQMRAMYDALDRGDVATAGRLQRWLTPKMAALFMFPSPSPVKAVLNAQGFEVGGCRLPIVTLNTEEKSQLATALGLEAHALEGALPLDLGGDLNA